MCYCLCWNGLTGCITKTVRQKLWTGCHLATPQAAESSSWSTFILLSIYITLCHCNLNMSVYIFIIILWFCWSVLCMQHLINVGLSWERDPPLWLLLNFLPFFLLNASSTSVSSKIKGLKTGVVFHYPDCKATQGILACDFEQYT